MEYGVGLCGFSGFALLYIRIKRCYFYTSEPLTTKARTEYSGTLTSKRKAHHYNCGAA